MHLAIHLQHEPWLKWCCVLLLSYGAPETTNKLLHSAVTPKSTIAHSDLVECIVKHVQGDKNAKKSLKSECKYLCGMHNKKMASFVRVSGVSLEIKDFNHQANMTA